MLNFCTHTPFPLLLGQSDFCCFSLLLCRIKIEFPLLRVMDGPAAILGADGGLPLWRSAYKRSSQHRSDTALLFCQ